jgi:raffinose/stachyose/melibiose transport system substrate-binding protein
VLQNAPDLLKANDLGWMNFPSVSGGKGNAKNIAGNTSNFYSVAKKTKNPAATVAFLKAQIMSKSYVKGLIALGNIPPVKGIEKQLTTGSNAAFTSWCYKLVNSAPNFQHSWDQVLSPNQANTLLTGLDQLLLKQITPEEFSAAMNKAK